MAKKGLKQRKPNAGFKISIIINMHEHNLGYRETARKYFSEEGKELLYNDRIKNWERIYRNEGEAGFMVEVRGEPLSN